MYAPISNQIFKINKLLSLLTLQKIQWTKWRTWKLISIKDDDKHSDIIVSCKTSTCSKKLTSSSLATETANCVLHFTSVARFVTRDNKQTKKDKSKTSYHCYNVVLNFVAVKSTFMLSMMDTPSWFIFIVSSNG